MGRFGRRYRKKRKINKGTVPVIILGILGLGYGKYKEYADKISDDQIFTITTIFVCILIFYIATKILYHFYKKTKYLTSDISVIDSMKGIEFEQYLKILFEKRGYKVEETPASGDYGVDLICRRKNKETGEKEFFVIQAKRSRDKIGIKAVQELIGGMHFYDCSNGIVITNSIFTDNAKRLAEKSNVVLWDRKVLKKEIIKIKRQQT